MLAYRRCVRSKKAGRKQTPFALENYICSFPPQMSNKSLQKYQIIAVTFLIFLPKLCRLLRVSTGRAAPRGKPGSGSLRVRQSQGITTARNSAGFKKRLDFYTENKNIQSYNRKY